jgi:hypothetical protein
MLKYHGVSQENTTEDVFPHFFLMILGDFGPYSTGTVTSFRGDWWPLTPCALGGDDLAIDQEELWRFAVPSGNLLHSY